jgi:sulfide:quinone oxidoreductase
VFAHAQTKVVAQQIADKLDGKTLRATFAGKGYCWIELGDGRAGFTGGDLYAEPNPRLKLRRPGRTLHGARWPSRNGGSTTGSRPERAESAINR